jgi:hypothetical protein
MDPVRLLDQPDLPAHERDALEAGRAQPPVAYDAAAGAERLAKSLSAGGGSGTGGGATAAAATQLGTKLIVGGVLASIAFVVALQMTTPHERQSGAARSPAPVVNMPQQPIAAPAPAPPASAAPASAATAVREPRKRAQRTAQSRATTEASEERAPAAAEPAVGPEPAVEPEPAAAAVEAPREEAPREEAAPSPSPAMLEMRAIAGAKRALSDDQPERALAILAGIARDYPKGYFIEERRALRVLALAADGESEQARREAASFLRDYPAGAFTQRVKAAGGQR